MKKIKPLFKTPNSKWHIHSWIIENFPKGYEELNYLEPCFGDGSVFFNKNKSAAEFINDDDSGTTHILRCLRDESKYFIEKLKRVKYSENTFNRITKKENLDHLNFAVQEFTLRRMSRLGEKATFIHSDTSIDAWYEVLEDLPRITERILESHIFNKPTYDVVRAFDENNTLVYVNSPHSVEDNLTSTNAYVKLSNLLNNFKGKVIVSSKPTAFQKRLYAGWGCAKKKCGLETECLFMNY